jgi:hypothetical protein
MVSMLEGDIKIGSEHFPKKVVIPAVGGTLIIAGVMVYRKRQAAATDAVAVAAGTADGNDIDTETGFPYGSTEDQTALAEMGSGALPTQSNSSAFQTGNVIGYDQFGDPIYGASPSGSSGTFTNNAQWTQAALASLVSADDSTDSGVISDALGVYINGGNPTAAQVSLIEQAIALEGPVPVPNADGYPPGIHTPAATTTGGGGAGTGTSGAKKPSKAPSGESVGNITQNSATLRWTSQSGATGYRVRVWLAAKATTVVHDSTGATTAQTVNGLGTDTKYGWHVAAVNPQGQGPFSSSRHFTTSGAEKSGPVHKKV